MVQIVDAFRLPGRQQAEELRAFELQMHRLAPPVVFELVLAVEVDELGLAVEEAEQLVLPDALRA